LNIFLFFAGMTKTFEKSFSNSLFVIIDSPPFFFF